MNKRATLFGFAGAFSLAATAWLAAQWHAPQEIGPVPDSRTYAPLASLSSGGAFAELEILRAKVAELEADQMRMLKCYLSLSLEQWAENGGRGSCSAING